MVSQIYRILSRAHAIFVTNTPLHDCHALRYTSGSLRAEANINPHLSKVQRMMCGWLFSAQRQKRVELRLMELMHHLHNTLSAIAFRIASALSQNIHSPLCRW